MKTTKAIPSDHLSSRRAQPVRQTRTNPPRSSAVPSRSFSARDVPNGGLSNGHNDERQMRIFPAITHFADAITALPREIVRHFTLLKEVDAKIFAPEETLAQLVEAALNCPIPDRQQNTETLQITGPKSATVSATVSATGSVTNGQNRSIAAVPDAVDKLDPTNGAWDAEDLPRRQLFRQCTYTMQEMLVSLDEKNHVISTATEALNKHMLRLDDLFPHIENEISEEARWGSTTHWAYAENRTSKPNDRARREIASVNHLANAANQVVDEAAARSEARKQAMLAKKGRLHQVESDFDDHTDSRHKGDLSKKPHGNSKKGRPADVGLGITNGGGTNGNPPSKRRKVEKGPTGGALMERSVSGVYSNNGIVSRGKVNSPRETPVPEVSKKRSKGATATNGHTKKRTVATNSNAMSPSLASSPIHTTFAEAKSGARNSPAPTNGGRQATSRARQGSVQSIVEGSRHRPSPSISTKLNGGPTSAPDSSTVAGSAARSSSDGKSSTKESATNTKNEPVAEQAEPDEPESRGAAVSTSRRDTGLKREDTETNGDAIISMPPTINTAVTTTKSGRASKPSTPALSQFPEPTRSRTSRAALETTASNKRSHKKGAGQLAQLLAAQAADEDASSSVVEDEDDGDIDADEPTYCYCNGVSYGEMVACDADGCAKEWFHLECVGLKVAPKGNAKWYCDDCKENLRNSKRINGR